MSIDSQFELSINGNALTERELIEVIKIAEDNGIGIEHIHYGCLLEDDESGSCGFVKDKSGDVKLKLNEITANYVDLEFMDDIMVENFHEDYEHAPTIYNFRKNEYDILIKDEIYQSIKMGENYESIIKKTKKKTDSI